MTRGAISRMFFVLRDEHPCLLGILLCDLVYFQLLFYHGSYLLFVVVYYLVGDHLFFGLYLVVLQLV